jgi:hypothetical protein
MGRAPWIEKYTMVGQEIVPFSIRGRPPPPQTAQAD